ncbi:hypothetical protein DH2020_007648 [Rehmannia glutinosa]|uniref:EGF-like domain-containing protein n=1 Tax=Rehmannia glutinosa TaxID=99300 RepID=A0ABR0TZ41_REHGL
MLNLTFSESLQRRGRALLGVPELSRKQNDSKQPIRIFLNYDAVGHSSDRDCRSVGDIVKASLGEPNSASFSGVPSCNPHGDPPIYGDCWYNCTIDDIAGEDKSTAFASFLQALGQTADWFRRALSVEPVRGNLRLSGYSHVVKMEVCNFLGNMWKVMHVLGFDPHAFAHFRDERKRRRTRVTEQAMDEKLDEWQQEWCFLELSCTHSFSENFTGLELEDGGGRGTSGSHWEKRLLMNEIMTGSVDTRSVVSKMTLALLEDSGWYRANYSMADRLDWGRNQGTEEAEGYCPIVSYSGDIPQWARYFPQSNKGGQSSLADYCTYFVAYSDGSCMDTNSARAPDRMLGEVRGSNSRCMASSLVRSGFVRVLLPKEMVVISTGVAVDGIWKVCPEAGGPIQFPGFNGSDTAVYGELICPAYHELCSVDPVPVSGQCLNSCHFNGDCVDGRCHCFLGFEGHDCSQLSCPNNCGGHGECLKDGICECENGYTGIDCSTGYTCQNSSTLLPSLSVCRDVLEKDVLGQHCAPSELSILQQLEEVVVMPNYHRLFPGGPRKFLNYIRGKDCDGAAKRLACWVS